MITPPQPTRLMNGQVAICQSHIDGVHGIVTILAIYSPAFKTHKQASEWLDAQPKE